MFQNVLSFIDKHSSFILTTHEPPDADGIGAQMVLISILKKMGKEFRIINAAPMPKNLLFMDNLNTVEIWDEVKDSASVANSALMVIDTSDEYHIGSMRETIKMVKETFIFDHHDPRPKTRLTGFVDPTAASTSELAVELACSMGVELDSHTANAAYAGIAYDSGFFAYPKTSIRTFRAAIKTIDWGAQPNNVYRQLMENASSAAILLQKQALSNLEFYGGRKIAVITLSMEDMEMAGAEYEDAENIVNIPLKAKEVEVSMLLKEKEKGEIRCSLRSKGKVNVSKIAQEFGGGGHISAAGLRSSLSMEETLKKLLSSTEAALLEMRN